MRKQRKRRQTKKPGPGAQDAPSAAPEPEERVKAPAAKPSKKNIDWARLEQFEKDFENQIREVEERFEKQLDSLAEENKALRSSITLMAKEIRKANRESKALKNKAGQLRNTFRKMRLGNDSFNSRLERLEMQGVGLDEPEAE